MLHDSTLRYTHGMEKEGRKEGNVLFNDALNTFHLRLYGVIHMVNDHSDSERGNPPPPHGLLFPISSKGSFICIIPQTENVGFGLGKESVISLRSSEVERSLMVRWVVGSILHGVDPLSYFSF